MKTYITNILFKSVLNSIEEAVVAVDMYGRIVYMNETASNLLEIDLKYAKLKRYADIFQIKHEKDISIEQLIELDPLVKKGRTKKFADVILLMQDGDPIHINFSVKPLINSRERTVGAVFIIHDRTKDKALEYAKEEFLSIASHQLRTPLGSMRWSLEMLLEGDVDDLGAKSKKLLEQIYKSNMRMITLVNDLLNISRIQQRKVKPEPIECNIIPIIKDALEELKPQIRKRRIKTHFNSNQSIKIKIDPKQFREVIQNLLSNSVKYNISGGIIKVEIKVYKKRLLLSIADNGIGIPKKAQNMIFKKFYRADNVTTMHTEGTGLGLFVVRSYIQSWGGRIWFQSPTIITKDSKRGTTFFIEIPR